jgi:hypothetical protein
LIREQVIYTFHIGGGASLRNMIGLFECNYTGTARQYATLYGGQIPDPGGVSKILMNVRVFLFPTLQSLFTQNHWNNKELWANIKLTKYI